jgi:hypothetical protein
MPMCVFSRRFSSYTFTLLRVLGVLFVFPWPVLVFRVSVPVRGAVPYTQYDAQVLDF